MQKDFLDKATDEQLAVIVKNKEAHYENAIEKLIARYKSTINSIIIRSGYNKIKTGIGYDDLFQEGMIAVFLAIPSYDGKSPFMPFASTCVKTRLVSIIRGLHRKKNQPLNTAISLTAPDDSSDDDKNSMMGTSDGPEEQYISKERVKEILEIIETKLTPFEQQIFSLHIKGVPYVEIAEKTGKNVKSVDNAVQRIKVKLKNIKEVN